MTTRKIPTLAALAAAAVLAACTTSTEPPPVAEVPPPAPAWTQAEPVAAPEIPGAVEVSALDLPDSVPELLALGVTTRREGRLDVSRAALEKAAGLDASQLKVQVNLARTRLDQDDPSAALAAAEAAVVLDPASCDALHQKGRALAALNRADEAEAVLTAARGADPDNGWAANTLGWLLLTRGRAAEALPHLEAARDRLPQVAFVHNNLGVAYERTGERERAILAYRDAVSAGDSEGKAAASLVRLGAGEDLACEDDLDASDDDLAEVR